MATKAIVIALPGLGDALMSTPLLRAIHEKLGFEVDLLVAQAGTFGVMETNPIPKRVIYFNFLKEGHLRSLRFLLGLRGKYDVSFTIYPSFPRQYHWVAWAIGARRRIGHRFESGYWSHFHFVYTDKIPAQQDIHNVYNNMNLLKPFGISAEPGPLEAYLTDEDRALAQRFLEQNDLVPGEYIFFHNGSSLIKPNSEKKRLPSSTVDALMRLYVEAGFRVVYNAGPDEWHIPAVEGVVVLRGQKIRTVGAVIEGAAVVVSNDSGPMHYASALRKKVVGIFGNTDPRKAYPFKVKSIVIKSDWSCAPCYVDYAMRYFPCTHPEFNPQAESFPCMAAFTPQEIFDATVKLLEEPD